MGEMLEMFRPDQYVRSVCDIDLIALKRDGYKAMMLDLDNTLLPWASSQVPESSRNWIESAKELGMRLCIVSNTHNPRRLSAVAKELGVASVFKALKPRPQGFEQGLKILGCVPENTVVVGDQLLTDILGGNWACMYTILVKPMHPKEFIGTRLSRLVERWIWSRLSATGAHGTNCVANKSEKRDTK
ncbi:MAG: YqeG family HAD IIIA-type phosphatase [Armatimonadota bacterium]|nr:YqeG family HAD IIIA-type phosphatase [bacterium]